jgi:type I restriction enzyme, S subunit
MKGPFATTRLADNCAVFADGDWIESKDQSSGGVRLVQTGNVGEGVFKDRSEKARYVSEATFKRLRCTEIFPGDCLISRLPDPVGRSCILPDTGARMITAVDCTIVRFDRRQQLPEFFNLYFQSSDYLKAVEAETTGTTRKRISRSRLGQIPVPVPGICEQHRIVGILNGAFEGIAIARGNAEKNRENARSLFQGQLELLFAQPASAAELGDSALDGILLRHPKTESEVPESAIGVTRTGGRAATSRHIPGKHSLAVGMPNQRAKKGWRWSLLTDLARLESGHTPSRRHPEYWGGAIPWLGIQDASERHGLTVSETRQHTNELGIANSSARVLPKNTVCLSRTASVGYVVVTGKPMATSQDFVDWVCSDQLDPHFLKYLFLAEGRERLLRFASGSVHSTIYFPEAKAFHICHPARDEQERIVAKLDSLKKQSERLENLYQDKIAALDELKRAVLHEAFAGAL